MEEKQGSEQDVLIHMKKEIKQQHVHTRGFFFFLFVFGVYDVNLPCSRRRCGRGDSGGVHGSVTAIHIDGAVLLLLSYYINISVKL